MNVPHFFTSTLLGIKTQNCVTPYSTVAPWLGGPIVRAFYSSQGVSSTPPAFFLGGGGGIFSLLKTRVNGARYIARRKDLCKLDGTQRSVDGARCRSPEDLCKLGRPHCCGVDGSRFRSPEGSV